ncbi:hypothetical protein AN958_05898 [Leucoagaricus sp. SymC.cos]|nr:hypothetical protein AN958_05898 [Leucoagaricus sp. SymC.cos]
MVLDSYVTLGLSLLFSTVLDHCLSLFYHTAPTTEDRVQSRTATLSREKLSFQYLSSVCGGGIEFSSHLPCLKFSIILGSGLFNARLSSHVPLSGFSTTYPFFALPLTIRPIIFLLQQLIPYISYIGAFTSWSWSFVLSFDRRNGVILTATWIVPIALIPGTWLDSDWPTSR